MDDISSPALTVNSVDIIAALHEGLLVLTESLKVEYASDKFLKTFQVEKDEVIGLALAELGDGQWNIPSLLEPLSHIVKNEDTLEDLEIEHEFDKIGRRVMRLNARMTVRVDNGSKQVFLAIHDVTKAADIARELSRQRRLAEGIVDTLREPLLVLDGGLRVIEASRAFYNSFKVNAEQTVGQNLVDLGGGQWANSELVQLLTEVIPDKMTIEDYEIEHDFPNIGRRIFLLNARKIFREGNNTKTLLLAMEDITDRRQLEIERQAALDQSNRLMEELNHRVMNSLSMIGAVIAMENRELSDEKCKSAFQRMHNRINSIGTLYRNLSKSASVNSVNADAYLGAVLRDTVDSVQSLEEAIDLDISIEKIVLSTRIAVPLGLIVNELATNSLKYAFRDRNTGVLSLHLVSNGDGVEMKIWDDGSGIDKNARVDSGLGQKLVQAFVQQVGGELSTTSGASGTAHILKIAHSEIAQLQRESP